MNQILFDEVKSSHFEGSKESQPIPKVTILNKFDAKPKVSKKAREKVDKKLDLFDKQRKADRFGTGNSLSQFEAISREIAKIESEIYNLNVQKADMMCKFNSSRFNPDIHNEDDFLDCERCFTGNPFSNIHPKCTKDHDLIKVKFGNTVFNHVDDDNKQCSVFEYSK